MTLLTALLWTETVTGKGEFIVFSLSSESRSSTSLSNLLVSKKIVDFLAEDKFGSQTVE